VIGSRPPASSLPGLRRLVVSQASIVARAFILWVQNTAVFNLCTQVQNTAAIRIFILRTLRPRRARNQSFGFAADFQAVAVATRQIPRFPSEVPSHPS
jgi:hypothetical protein